MSLTRLKNIITSRTGRIIYVNPDDFDASDAIDNRGNSALRPFKSLQRAFLEVARLSKKGTRLATFTAASAVRRGLRDVGFDMVKIPGFGRKREMLTGYFL